MIHTKRGLSDIITNVLIILLVLVAIGIIWAFVRPAIQGGAQQISGANDCLTTTVTPVGCVFNGTQNNATVVFQRGTGSGDVRAIRLILSDNSGASTSTDETTIPATFATGSRVINITAFNPTRFDTAFEILTSDGQTRTCELTGSPVSCTQVL